MSDPGWRKYECPICKAQRVDREPKEDQPPLVISGLVNYYSVNTVNNGEEKN